ncbi:MAG: PEP-CTERM sorting domain-containing protein [Opitutae bacterium]|nr:PEP-CTERM sorting domain-containing protein [Opitutae bacterium]
MSKVITIAALVAASTALASAADWQTVEYTLSNNNSSTDTDSVTTGNSSFASFTIDGSSYDTFDASEYNWKISFSVDASGEETTTQTIFSLGRTDTGADGYGVVVGYDGTSTYTYAISATAHTNTEDSDAVTTSSSSVSVVFSWDALSTTLSLSVDGSEAVTLTGVSTESANLVAGEYGDQGNAHFWSNSSAESITGISLQVQQVPEPSMFGLLAGLGALGLVATRRRRNRKA